MNSDFENQMKQNRSTFFQVLEGRYYVSESLYGCFERERGGHYILSRTAPLARQAALQRHSRVSLHSEQPVGARPLLASSRVATSLSLGHMHRPGNLTELDFDCFDCLFFCFVKATPPSLQTAELIVALEPGRGENLSKQLQKGTNKKTFFFSLICFFLLLIQIWQLLKTYRWACCLSIGRRG